MAKTARAKGTAPRSKTAPAAPSGESARIRRIAVVAALAAVVVIGLLFLRGRGASHDGAPDGFGHVHAVAVDPGSGSLHVATHVGLFRVEAVNRAVRVSEDAPDLMGFAVVGPGRFLASGHPGWHDDGPMHLGLVESTDGGVTWRTLSLAGAADFHGLRWAHERVYGYNSTEGTFMVSTDRRTWQTRSRTAIASFAVDPADPDVVLAVTPDGVHRSDDGGRTWQVVSGAPDLTLLAWEEPGQVWGVTRDGMVWRSADGGDTWQRRGSVDGRPHALTVHGSEIIVALAGDRIVASGDGAISFTTRYAPAS